MYGYSVRIACDKSVAGMIESRKKALYKASNRGREKKGGGGGGELVWRSGKSGKRRGLGSNLLSLQKLWSVDTVL